MYVPVTDARNLCVVWMTLCRMCRVRTCRNVSRITLFEQVEVLSMMAKKLKQENDELRNQFDALTREISDLKEVISKGESSAGSADWSRHNGRSKAAVEASRSDEVSPDNMQFLSDGYDDLNVFR